MTDKRVKRDKQQAEAVQVVLPQRIGGSPSLDEIFGVGAQRVGENKFNVSPCAADAEMKIAVKRPTRLAPYTRG
jgi:hypothetical protein